MSFSKAKEMFEQASYHAKQQKLEDNLLREKVSFYEGVAELIDGFEKLAENIAKKDK